MIKPWALTVPVGEQQITVEGLHQVDEAALNRLDDATFLKLRKTSGLPSPMHNFFRRVKSTCLLDLISFKSNCCNRARQQRNHPVSQRMRISRVIGAIYVR